MSTRITNPEKVAIIGASGTYGRGILARAEKVGVEVVVVSNDCMESLLTLCPSLAVSRCSLR